MKHKHHIIPRLMGGSDDPSNLIEVTVEEHAELHLDLYLEHGHWQDWVASQALSGQATYEESTLEAIRQSSRRTCLKRNRENNPMKNPESVNKMKVSIAKYWEENGDKKKEVAERQRKAITGMKRTDEQKENIRKAAVNRWKDPEQRAKQAEAIKNSWIKRRTK